MGACGPRSVLPSRPSGQSCICTLSARVAGCLTLSLYKAVVAEDFKPAAFRRPAVHEDSGAGVLVSVLAIGIRCPRRWRCGRGQAWAGLAQPVLREVGVLAVLFAKPHVFFVIFVPLAAHWLALRDGVAARVPGVWHALLEVRAAEGPLAGALDVVGARLASLPAARRDAALEVDVACATATRMALSFPTATRMALSFAALARLLDGSDHLGFELAVVIASTAVLANPEVAHKVSHLGPAPAAAEARRALPHHLRVVPDGLAGHGGVRKAVAEAASGELDLAVPRHCGVQTAALWVPPGEVLAELDAVDHPLAVFRMLVDAFIRVGLRVGSDCVVPL